MKCTKVRYGTELGAKIALSQTWRSGSATREEMRVYRCRHCYGWHLTSQPRRSR